MKIKLIISKDVDERVEIYTHEKSDLIEQIENAINNYHKNIPGYIDDEIVLLPIDKIYRFYIENNKIFATTETKRYWIKLRLYQIENMLGSSFIKINQSCLVNKNKIKKFSSSWGGTLLVELTNGETDYISRRQTKIVMERMGIK